MDEYCDTLQQLKQDKYELGLEIANLIENFSEKYKLRDVDVEVQRFYPIGSSVCVDVHVSVKL